jgi:hypothetical protein
MLPLQCRCQLVLQMLLVPLVDGNALDSGSTRYLLWAYFFVYRFE